MSQLTFAALTCLIAVIGCDAAPPDRSGSIAVTASAETGNVRSLLNAERARNGLGPLRRSRQLTASASVHADDMAARGYFSHTGSNGASLGGRVRRQGYGYCVVAENISKGRSDPAAVIAGWMASPGHRRNILNPDVTEFGLARAPGNIWVLDLARPGC